MLAINYRSSFSFKRLLVVTVIVACVAAISYGVVVYFSPVIARAFFVKPITVSDLAKPTTSHDRLVIPKLGLDLSYGTNSAMLDDKVQWRDSSLGNPEDGGTMRLAAHRLSLQLTPQQTVAQSPFFAIDTLKGGDKLIVDYRGTRYGFEVTHVASGAISETSLPETSGDSSMLVLFTYDSADDATRTVVSAKALGKVAIE